MAAVRPCRRRRCAGAADHAAAGTCEIDRGNLRCACHPTAQRLVHGVLGTVELRTHEDWAWFDVRNIGGGIDGTIPAGSARCDVTLETSRGALHVEPDSVGRFTLLGVPAGRYAFGATCRTGPGFSPVPIAVEDRLRQVAFGRPDKYRGVPILHDRSRQRAATATESVERELTEYTFPRLPPAEAGTGERPDCTARVKVAADGTLSDLEWRDCTESRVEVATPVVRTWRWKPGPTETTEELRVPFVR